MPNSFPQIENTIPLSDELEVSVFGPGVGECIVVHFGNGQWMIVDSCLDSPSKQPIAKKYLTDIGVDISTAVKLILVSHWHDDHIRGLSNIVESCTSARFCCPSALLQEEFLSLVSTYSGRLSLLDYHTAGTRELAKVIDILKKRRTPGDYSHSDCIVKVGVDRVLVDEITEKYNCNVKALSPSDKSELNALLSFAEMIPSGDDERVTITDQIGPNHNAVVLWINFNETVVLLGSDLEETSDPQTGWKAIVNSPVSRHGKALIFKIPHHGSPNGHNHEVWAEMVENNSIGLLTPYSRGKTPRPQQEDIERIKMHTENLFWFFRFKRTF